MATTLSAGTSTSGAVLSPDTSGVLQLQSGSTPTTAMTITSSQQVGIGTTSPSVELNVIGDIQLQRSTGVSDAAINFGSNTNNYIYSGNNSNVMAFAVNGSERARIDANGNLLVNSTSSAAGAKLFSTTSSNWAGMFQCGNGASALGATNTSGTSGYNAMVFFNNGTSFSQCGSINVSGSSTAYVTSSDPRLKTISGPVTPAAGVAFVNALKPVTGTWNTDGSAFTGFLTTDYETVDPAAVVGTANATQPVGNITDATGKVLQTGVPQPTTPVTGETWTQTGTAPIYQQMEYGSSAWCANMTAALQSALATIADMQTKLHAAGVAGF